MTTLDPPPPTRRQDIVETIHGVPVADPYRWLENGDSPEVRSWVAAQNARTARLLAVVPGRAAIETRLTDLFRVTILDEPRLCGRRLFYVKRGGDQAQAVLCWRDGPTGEERVLVDPNRLDERGLTALDWWQPSHDGARLAYGTSQNGDEWSTLRVIDVESGELLSDTIERTRYSTIAWLPGNEAFFYTRYPAPGSVPPGEENYNRHVFLHRLGQDPSADPKIFGEGRSPQDMIAVESSPDGRWLVVLVAIGWSRTDVYLRDLTLDGAPFEPVVEGVDAICDNIRFAGDRVLLRTNLDAPRYRIVSINPRSPRGGWTTIVSERQDRVIEGFELAGGRLVVNEMESAVSRLRVYALDNGRFERDLPLPGLGTVNDLAGDPEESLVVASYSSLGTPPTFLGFDVATGEEMTPGWSGTVARATSEAIEVEQVRFPSKDGTLITMFLCRRADLARSDDTATILTGYGGFNIPIRSGWQPSLVAWIEQGGLVAIPNLRGGGEYGEEWHRAGMLDRKQNVFDDCIAAAEWLVAKGYTRPERLAVQGGSNGGLLVGAVITQRPDLFRAAVCMVPLLDMLRYDRFSVAKLWVPEYGSADDPDAFRWLHAYSPYHRVRPDTDYPAVLFTAAEQDSRVDPLHARKMTALLQWATEGRDERPILLRQESEAGHGVGKPLWKRVEEAADELSFLVWQLGVASA